MRNFLLFVEGESDAKFLKDFIKCQFDIDISDDSIIVTKTLNGFVNYKDNFIGNSTKDDGVNILLIDADDNINQRQSDALSLIKEHKISTELFLMPNNSNNGNLEDLLCEIAVHKSILSCYDSYSFCIKSADKIVPDKKDKIRAYLSALISDKNKSGVRRDLIQYKNRNYLNTDHWDLTHSSLEPLKIFLSLFFSKN